MMRMRMMVCAITNWQSDLRESRPASVASEGAEMGFVGYDYPISALSARYCGMSPNKIVPIWYKWISLETRKRENRVIRLCLRCSM